MARPSIYSLPVELHTMIMQYLLSSSRQFVERRSRPNLPSTDSTPSRPEFVQQWIERDPRSPSSFPYNVAWTWTLWLAILSKIPECWTRVVFDVAKDPSPFLGSFAWSKNRLKSISGIEVVVYNSCPAANVRKAMEAQRISAISKALSPHVPRCKSITFHSAFSSSLPPPNVFFLQGAPHLEKLTLECGTDDIDVIEIPPTAGQWRQFTSFPSLRDLSLTGFWFMYLVQHAQSSWLQELQLAEHTRPELKVSDFAFQETGDYSLVKFIEYLSALGDWSLFHLSRLSLSYTHDSSSRPSNTDSAPLSPDLHFESVSKYFLSAFGSMVAPPEYDERGQLMFQNCELPTGMHGFGRSCELLLEGIIDNDHKAGMRDTVNLCCAVDLDVTNCPSFDDDDLRWLGTPQDDDLQGGRAEFPVDSLESLTIVNCPKVSAQGIIGLLEKRLEDADNGTNDESDDDTFKLTSIDVRGKGLGYLTEEEKEIFRRLHELLGIVLMWTVEEADGRRSEFSSETSAMEE